MFNKKWSEREKDELTAMAEWKMKDLCKKGNLIHIFFHFLIIRVPYGIQFQSLWCLLLCVLLPLLTQVGKYRIFFLRTLKKKSTRSRMQKLKFILTSTQCSLDCRPLSTSSSKFISLSSAHCELHVVHSQCTIATKSQSFLAFSIQHSTRHLTLLQQQSSASKKSNERGEKYTFFSFLYEHLRVSDLIRSF